jgi:hypothetical protein
MSNIDALAARLGQADSGTHEPFNRKALLMPPLYSLKSGCSSVFHRVLVPLANDLASVDIKHRVQAATELRDSIEYICTQQQQYPYFLKKLVPVFVTILDGPPVFVSTSWEQVCFSPLCL